MRQRFLHKGGDFPDFFKVAAVERHQAAAKLRDLLTNGRKLVIFVLNAALGFLGHAAGFDFCILLDERGLLFGLRHDGVAHALCVENGGFDGILLLLIVVKTVEENLHLLAKLGILVVERLIVGRHLIEQLVHLGHDIAAQPRFGKLCVAQFAGCQHGCCPPPVGSSLEPC